MSILIGLFSLLAVVFAGLVLVARQPMRAALSLVGMMVSLAAIYACLGAHVVAVFQVLIYVGAVMVFMVYTIMLLDDRDSSFKQPFSKLVVPALIVAACAVTGLWMLIDGQVGGQITGSGYLYRFSEFSRSFMQLYWFHFELATVLLLVGIIAAWTALKEGQDG